MSIRTTRSQSRRSHSTNSVSNTILPDIEDSVSEDIPQPARKRRHNEIEDIALPLPTRTPAASKSKRQTDKSQLQTGAGVVKRVQRRPAQQELQSDGSATVQAPANWEEMYSLTAAMRKLNPAPVDTMGCESLAEAGLSDRDRRFQTLIALMLSSQTKDTVTALTVRRLQTELPRPGLTLERILEVQPDKLNEIIWAVGFHNNKTKFIKKTAEILKEKFNSDIPNSIEGMTSLPGVGPKMAYLCMSSAWGRDEGIGVDVHVHRITNLWGWHRTKNPEQTRAVLESWLPKDKWHDINHLLVGFGQTICVPIGRRCYECTLSERKLCPSAVIDRKVQIRGIRGKKSHQGTTIKIEEEALIADGSLIKNEATTDHVSPATDEKPRSSRFEENQIGF